MVRFSNSLVGLLNLVTFVLSAAILGGGIWLATKADTDCEKFLQWPLIVIGGFLIIVSLAGLVGACCRVTWLLWLYSAAMFLLILVLFCFTIFAFVITNKGAGRAVSGRGYKEYRLGDYSNWLQKRVEKRSNWNTIKSCIGDANICKKIADDSANEVAEEFYEKNLSPTQGAGHAVSGRGYKEYRLGDYSNWLQSRVKKSSNWHTIRSCVRDARVCNKLAEETIGDDAQRFYAKKLSPIQSGCCKPPASCNFVYVNATYWSSTTSSSVDTECSKWSNDQNQLCYNCNSCKAGVVGNLKNNWRKISFISFAVLIALIVVYSMGCCAFRNSRNDELHDYKGYT